MPTRDDVPEDEVREDDPKATRSIRLRTRTAEMIDEISEATGKPHWHTVDRLIKAALAAEHKRVQPRLKKVREQKAKVKAEQQQTLEELEG